MLNEETYTLKINRLDLCRISTALLSLQFEINVELENKFGVGGIELTNTALGGTQITWKNMCLGSADLETIDEIMDQLRFLRTEVYYGNKLSRTRRQRNEDGGR